MIIDTLDNINFYFGISKELDAVLSVLKHYSLSHLKAGEYPDFPIEGYGILLKIMEPELVGEGNHIPWEYHLNCIDVMCVLEGGTEIIGYAPRNKLTGWHYDPEKDVAYTEAECDYLPIMMQARDFGIFFPQDAHRKVKSSGQEGYHKLLFKVPIAGNKLKNQF